MSILERGRLIARLAEGDGDVQAALDLRSRCFRDGAVCDRDRFDRICRHVLIEDRNTGELVCCFRLMQLAGSDFSQSYSGQFYDLTKLGHYPGTALEMGRFCIDPERLDGDILRLAWGAMTRLVDRAGIGLLFGCSSFRGTDAGRYGDVFDWMAARHLAPRRWRPGIKASRVVRFAPRDAINPNLRKALAATPPLLRTYLSMGGWVSDHAVLDAELDTIHVFTGLEIAKVPPARARLLRAIAD